MTADTERCARALTGPLSGEALSQTDYDDGSDAAAMEWTRCVALPRDTSSYHACDTTTGAVARTTGAVVSTDDARSGHLVHKRYVIRVAQTGGALRCLRDYRVSYARCEIIFNSTVYLYLTL